MSKIKIGLTKILETLLLKEYPGISDIKVIPMSDDIDCKFFQVSIGLSPAHMKEYRTENIRNYATSLSKFVLDKDEKIMIIFYNSEIKN
jgi:hypothetical protein